MLVAWLAVAACAAAAPLRVSTFQALEAAASRHGDVEVFVAASERKLKALFNRAPPRVLRAVSPTSDPYDCRPSVRSSPCHRTTSFDKSTVVSCVFSSYSMHRVVRLNRLKISLWKNCGRGSCASHHPSHGVRRGV